MSDKNPQPSEDTGSASADGSRVRESLEKKNRIDKENKALREHLDPTRYGDWEKNGRCIDF